MLTCFSESVQEARLENQIYDGAGEGIGGDPLNSYPLPSLADMTRQVVEVALVYAGEHGRYGHEV